MRLTVDTFIRFAVLMPAFILHELAHAATAYGFGDDTGKRAGRLTLNPSSHLDPFGSLILPALGSITGAPFLAFAKPIPVNYWKLRNPRTHSLLVSLAGPASNLLLAIVGIIAARPLLQSAPRIGDLILLSDASIVARVAFWFGFTNLLLGVFNLLPIPPLDGSAILERFLPTSALANWHKFKPYGMLVLIVLVFSTDWANRVFQPWVDWYGRALT